MNVQEFQNKLKEVQEIARQHGNALNAAEIRQVFEECDLDKSQLLGVLKYLTSQGILIEGLETAGEEAKEPRSLNIKKFLLQQKKKLILKIIWRNCRLLMRWMLTVYLKLWQPVIRGHFRHLLLII